MNRMELTASQRKLWRLAAVLVPVVQLAARCTWLEAGAAAAAGGILQRIAAGSGQMNGRIGNRILRILGILALVNSMDLLQRFWNSNAQTQWLPVILLCLAAWQAMHGSWQTAQSAIVLLWLTGFLIGGVVLSAVTEIRPENLQPFSGRNDWDPALNLGTVVLLSGMAAERERTGKKTWLPVMGIAVTAAICVQGVLSGKAAASVSEPLYELSRSTRFLGSMQRFESLTILGVLLGAFQWMSCLLCLGEEEKRGEGKWEILVTAVLAVLFYIQPFRIEMWMFYVLTAAVCVLTRGCKKKE